MKKKRNRGGKCQKTVRGIATFPLLILAAWCCVREAETERYVAAGFWQAEPIACVEDSLAYEESKAGGKTERAALEQPRIDVSLMEKRPAYELSKEDYESLCRIVEAEAGTEDENGKLLVANVVLNRVKNEAFPDTVTEVVYQKQGEKAQFSPVSDGKIYTVKVSSETKEAVNRALMGEDISQGALYFMSRKAADPENMRWFDSHLVRLFSYGGHEFFG